MASGWLSLLGFNSTAICEIQSSSVKTRKYERNNSRKNGCKNHKLDSASENLWMRKNDPQAKELTNAYPTVSLPMAN